MLYGFPSPLPVPSRSVEWETAKLWDSQLAYVNASRPSTVEGIEALSLLYELLEMMHPDMLCNEVIIAQRNRTAMEQEREVTEKLLEQVLHDNQG